MDLHQLPRTGPAQPADRVGGAADVTADGVRQLADAGVGAVVLPSLFEEQLSQRGDPDSWLAGAARTPSPRR